MGWRCLHKDIKKKGQAEELGLKVRNTFGVPLEDDLGVGSPSLTEQFPMLCPVGHWLLLEKVTLFLNQDICPFVLPSLYLHPRQDLYPVEVYNSDSHAPGHKSSAWGTEQMKQSIDRFHQL